MGALLSGIFADRFGRKLIFQVTLLGYALATGLSGLAWGLGSLLIFRFLVGLGVGGELPVASTLVSELSPARHRGRLIVILESFWAYGWILAAIIGFFVVPRAGLGWRWAFFLGTLPALYVVILRRAVPEVAALAHQRRAARRGGGDPGDDRAREWRRAGAARGRREGGGRGACPGFGSRAAFRRVMVAPYRRRTIMLWLLWFGIVYSLLRRLHLAPFAADRTRLQPQRRLRQRADHHPGAVAGLLQRGLAG